MKKVFAILFALTLGFGLISCSSDDDNGGGPNYSVVGKWIISNYTVGGTSVEDCITEGIRQFKPDGTLIQEHFEENEAGVCVETENSPLIGTYTKSGNNLSTTIDGVTKAYDLEFQSETKFTITETYNNVDFVFTFTKTN